MASEKIIELVRCKPFLYNPKHPDHKNRLTVQNGWKEIGDELECHG